MVDVALRDLGEYVQAALPDAVLDVVLERDELCLLVERDRIARVLKFLRDDVNCQFKQLMDVCLSLIHIWSARACPPRRRPSPGCAGCGSG